MKVLPLPSETIARFGFTHKVILDYTDLTAAGLTKSFNVFPTGTGELPGACLIGIAAVVIDKPFVGAGVTTLTVAVGDEDVADRYLADANNSLLAVTGTGIGSASTAPFIAPDPTPIRVRVTAVGANLSVLTAGQCSVYISVRDLNELTKI